MNPSQPSDPGSSPERPCQIRENRQEAIDRYLLGEMSSAEADSFEGHLLYCPPCSEACRLQESIINVLSDSQVLGAEIPETNAFPPPGNLGKSALLWRVAAIFLLLLASGSAFWWLGLSSDNPWKKLGDLDPAQYRPQFWQGNGETAWENYNSGVNLLFDARRPRWWGGGYDYREEQVRQAIARFSAIELSQLPEDRRMDVLFYLSKAHLVLGEIDPALSALDLSGQVAVNRLKVDRALALCEGIEKELELEIPGKGDPPGQAQLQRARAIRANLEGLLKIP